MSLVMSRFIEHPLISPHLTDIIKINKNLRGKTCETLKKTKSLTSCRWEYYKSLGNFSIEAIRQYKISYLEYQIKTHTPNNKNI